jgi:hypothetical protein
MTMAAFVACNKNNAGNADEGGEGGGGQGGGATCTCTYSMGGVSYNQTYNSADLGYYSCSALGNALQDEANRQQTGMTVNCR